MFAVLVLSRTAFHSCTLLCQITCISTYLSSRLCLTKPMWCVTLPFSLIKNISFVVKVSTSASWGQLPPLAHKCIHFAFLSLLRALQEDRDCAVCQEISYVLCPPSGFSQVGVYCRQPQAMCCELS